MTKNKQNIFRDMPVWKALLRMSFPSLIITLVFGAYLFSDQILSIQFARDSYGDIYKQFTHYDPSNQIRFYMGAFSPINSFMIACALLFAVGTATRVSINLGAQRHERAKNTMKTGFVVGIIFSIILIPVLMFSAKPWIGNQVNSNDAAWTKTVETESFKYAWIIIMSFPLMMFNQMIPSLMRTEGRNREPVIALVIPIFINLLFDYILMGPAGMGIEGGAWATFISTSTTFLILITLLLIKRKAFVNLKDLFSWKSTKIISIVGILLVGVSPFIRNMSQSITSTVQMSVMGDVSKVLYKDINGFDNSQIMKLTSLGAMPIFMLFFPIVFGFVQGASPLASYFYGAKEYTKLKKVYIWSLIYMVSISTITYFVGAWILAGPLMDALGVKSNPIMVKLGFDQLAESKAALKIILLTMIIFSFAISGVVILGATDRLIFSIIASSLQGFIVFFPTIYAFKEIAITYAAEYKYAFWWFWPTSGALSGIIISIMTWYSLRQIKHKKTLTLDERIQRVHEWAKAKKNKSK